MPSQIGQRLAFQNAANAVKRAGMNPGSAVLSQSYLRMEALISTSATTYKFDVTTQDNVNTNFVTQQKLNLQDAFVVSQVGYFLFVPSAVGATDTLPTAYPTVGSVQGTAAIFTAAQAQAALAAYNGFMQLTVNQRTIITAWDLLRHYRAPTTQQNATTTAVATGSPTAPYHSTFDAFDGSTDGFYPCEPNIVINGGKKNDLTITLPVAISAAPATARLVLLFRGILAQNVTSVN